MGAAPERLPADGSFNAIVIRSSWWVFFFSFLLQCVLFWSIENLVCMIAVGFGWLIITRIFFRQSMLLNFPLSSFIIIGFVSSALYLPLVFTTLEGKPLIFNLELPEEIFLHSILALLVLVVAHAIYRFLWRSTFTRSTSVMERLGFFTAPRNSQLWIMGAIGLTAQWYVYFSNPEGREITGTVTDKLIQALAAFSYAPFFMPFGKLYGNHEHFDKKLYPLLIAFTVFLFVVGIGQNSRGFFMVGVTSAAFAYILALLLGIYKSKLFTLRNAIIAGILFWLLTKPIADLGTAMVIVRSERESVPAEELITLTLEAYDDKDAIRERRLEDKIDGASNEWDEPYLDNIFAARFANIKFADMTLIQYDKIGQFDPDMQQYSIDHFWGILPDPFLTALGIDVDKEEAYSYSFGDCIYLLAGGTGFPKGFRTGHMAGTGLAAFGWWYLAILGVLIMPTFLLFDKLYKKIRSPKEDGPSRAQFSMCGLLLITTIYQFMFAESVVNIAEFLVRGWIQMALLYFFVFHFTRILSMMFIRKRRVSLPV